jgi:uncharacterized protein YraI/GH18 family chitinase
MIYAILLLCTTETSIHQIEYYEHRDQAKFSAIANQRQEYVPLCENPRAMLKNYYGYCPYWIDTTYYGYFQMELLTHCAYFSVDIDPSTGNLGGIPNASRFTRIRDYSHERGVRIHMTFIVFGSSNVTAFLNNASARQTAIDQISNFITNYGIEGANIDFEFITSSVRDSFNVFITELGYALHNHPNGWKELYIASIAVPEWYPGYDLAHLSAETDGLFIMAYDYHWSGSSVAGPVSPCVGSGFWGQYCVAKSIGSYKAAGADGLKIILGLPYYGFDWPTVSEDMGSSTTGTGSAVIYYYAFQDAITYGRLWDSNSLTPWYRYYTSEWHQCWYDDSASLGIKYTMVNDSILQGAGCWALGYDRSYDHLWNAIRRHFWVEPPLQHFCAEVMVPGLSVRNGPGPEYTELTTADSGCMCVACDYTEYWYKIFYPSSAGPYYAWVWGGSGFADQTMHGATQRTIIRVSTSLLNVREGPGTSYPVITMITEGQCFVIDSVNGNWVRIHMPTVNGFAKGWVHSGYGALFTNPEDFNLYACDTVFCMYDSVFNALEVFPVSLRIKNTGYGPFDTLLCLYADEPSPFYTPGEWIDSCRAVLWGAVALPNQSSDAVAYFRAPFVIDTVIVSDTFRFARKDSIFGDVVVITVKVQPLSVNEVVSPDHIMPTISQTIFCNQTVLNVPGPAEYDLDIVDVTGRVVNSLTAVRHENIEIGAGLSPGIYFLLLRQSSDVLVFKIIKIK